MVKIYILTPIKYEKLARQFRLELAKYFGFKNVRLRVYNGDIFQVYVNDVAFIYRKNVKNVEQLNAIFWHTWRLRKRGLRKM